VNESCVFDPNSVRAVCVGGTTTTSVYANSVYTAVMTGNVASWTQTTSYPVSVYSPSCVADSGYVYCVGGAYSTYGTSASTNAAYYAPITGGGLGTWAQTTNYPSVVSSESCVAYGGYVYCVGGQGNSYTNAVYYAQLTSGGVGTWNAAPGSNYPITDYNLSCVVDSGFIYCIGGQGPSGEVGNVYYSAISPASHAPGAWRQTTSYPTPVSQQSCVDINSYVYCVAGNTPGPTNAVYYASLASGLVGPWTQTTGYPASSPTLSCVANIGYLDCVGGGATAFSNAVYYSKPVEQATTTVTSTATVRSSVTQTSTETTTTTQTATTTSTVSAGTVTSTVTSTVTQLVPTTVTSTSTIQSAGPFDLIVFAKNSAGAPVPAVAVNLTSLANGMVKNLTTNSTGVAVFIGLSRGLYNVAAIVNGTKLATDLTMDTKTIVVLEPNSNTVPEFPGSSLAFVLTISIIAALLLLLRTSRRTHSNVFRAG